MAPPAGAPERSLPEPAELADSYLEVAQGASRLLGKQLKRTARKGLWLPSEEIAWARAFMDLSAHALASPYRLAQAQMAMMRDQFLLLQQSTLRAMGMPSRAVATPEQGDRRFDDHAWDDNFLFDYIKQSYLIAAHHLHQTVARVHGLDAGTQEQVNAFTRQYVDALSPTNFALTNPEVLRKTVSSKGRNLLKGLKHLLRDLESGDAPLPGQAADGGALRLGRDLATTPGKVVFENELLQLIQFAPAGSHQCRKPLLIVPPWLHKYYVLDLRDDESLVKWLVDRGFTTFIISWVNPDQRLARKSFEDYVVDGVLAAIDAVEQATAESRLDLVGYGLGGTLLMATLAVMAARRDRRAASASFLATLLDFSEPGEVGALAGADPLTREGSKASRASTARASTNAGTCTMLHANDLIWSFVVNRYLLGKTPFPADLLYWIADSTRLPAALHRYCLDNFYRGNRLPQPGGITLAGVDVDLARVKIPCYFLATIEDHISPWRSSYLGSRLPRGPVRFVLGGSGHVAGIVNPPSHEQHGFWSNEELPQHPDDFLAGAVRHPGSWWTDWEQWLLAQPDGNTLVVARHPGDGALAVIEDAPGRYVA
ncbi:MAG: class I poly(R)-hydroxyalkanoic acid synthase [Candidatus Accumulibacter sp.]|uniref:PHA/PHB synthase family protein n=1 Tax=Accumulibacter sp. TaxID=2053492 RepID=UPI0025CB934A|nr:class I poly(R)-hydroxyalkanoic acid synthase [Accumulibacter sp.]MCP5248825.1 class I poly(R)-hydroxyalkanoic acid synthase [Accumulibacter sp.]